MTTPPANPYPPTGQDSMRDTVLLDAWVITDLAQGGEQRRIYRARPTDDDGGDRAVLVYLISDGEYPVDYDPEALAEARHLRVEGLQRLYTYGQVEPGGEGTLHYALVTPADGAVSLASRIVIHPPPFDAVVTLLADTARGLAAVHERGRAYGPLTPEHVMLTEDEVGAVRAALLPVWWMWRHGADDTPSAPWRHPGADIDDPAADAWSLGALLWHAFTGAPPLNGTEASLPRFAPMGSVVDRTLPADLELLVAELLDPQPEHRLRDMDQAARSLQAIAEAAQDDDGPGIAPPMLMFTPVMVQGQLRQRSGVLPFAPPTPSPRPARLRPTDDGEDGGEAAAGRAPSRGAATYSPAAPLPDDAATTEDSAPPAVPLGEQATGPVTPARGPLSVPPPSQVDATHASVDDGPLPPEDTLHSDEATAPLPDGPGARLVWFIAGGVAAILLALTGLLLAYLLS